MATYHIHIEGQVQGVGFRPFVYQLAHQYQLTGWVSNGVDGVHIEVTGEESEIADFYQDILDHPPLNARIINNSLQALEETTFESFSIQESTAQGKPNLLLTPDLGICPECREELHRSSDPRYHYAFTTCLKCGPRYSIINGLPYDRPFTSMRDFGMCPSCLREYDDPTNRRFFSQTNSCPECAVHLFWYNLEGQLLSQKPQEIMAQAVAALEAGKILAVKGIGGYLLMADGTSAKAVSSLRERKNRPVKPFALLYPDLHTLEKDVYLTKAEQAEWQSIESPIVLFTLRPQPQTGIQTTLIAPGLDRIGVMQPYAPLLELLATGFGKPLIATSGNRSGFPIFYQDEAALRELTDIADFFLVNDREIVTPQDDSVVAYSSETQQRVVYRRSRGLAPNYVHRGFASDQSYLSMGASLKSTFGFMHAGNTYISQYLGDTDSYDVQCTYQSVLRHLMKLFRFRPDYVVTDLHPDYFSTREGQQFAERYRVPCIPIQHHVAHFGAVLAENQLFETAEPVLGVIWDGTGYGEDGNIWGGEFFTYRNNTINRAQHFSYYPHLAGDKMAAEPRISALALAGNYPAAHEILQPKFTDQEWKFYTHLRGRTNGLQTSSMGRIFDAVASLVGICDQQTFEGEAAMQLQRIGAEWHQSHPAEQPYDLDTPDSRQLLQAVVQDLAQGEDAGAVSVRFHLTLVRIIAAMARQENINRIAFSGGVFQNTFLLDLIRTRLANDFTLYFHRELSPNDENIAYGQLAIAIWQRQLSRKEADYERIELTK
jgi:hydrogenase maturation protein HypF